jgi:hypothetical protein
MKLPAPPDQAKGHQSIRSDSCYFQKKINRKEIGDQNQAIHTSHHDQQQGVEIGLMAIMLEIIYRKNVMQRLTREMVNNINKLKPSRAICRLTFSPNQLIFWRREPREKTGLMSRIELINKKGQSSVSQDIRD